MATHWLDHLTVDELVRRIVLRTPIVLDIGCGIRPQSLFKPAVHICCEPHAEYLEALKDYFKGANAVLIPTSAQDAVKWMPDKSVDSVFMIDFIEHIEKSEGEAILKECERIARQEIVVFTPLGFMPQHYEGNELDAWGLHGTRWQTHRSGWVPEDFPSWHVFGAARYHTVLDRATGEQRSYGAFWAIRRFARIERDAGYDLASGKKKSWFGSATIDIDRQVAKALPGALRFAELKRLAEQLASVGLRPKSWTWRVRLGLGQVRWYLRHFLNG